MIPERAIIEWREYVPWIKEIMDEKMQEEIFLTDTQTLLRPSLIFNAQAAYEVVKKELIEKIK